jgi:AbrB family looped-hinge helix DNA binding protein
MSLENTKKPNPFRSVVTVSDRGQIVIPASLMRELNIVKGSQMIIMKRDDDLGFIALKSDAISDTLLKLSRNNPV